MSLCSAKVPPVALGPILVAIGRLLANGELVGITSGHYEVRHLVAAFDQASP